MRLCFSKNYSEVYNLLYKGKNYKKEFNFIKKIIRKYQNKSKTLLDVGCGTGSYSKLMTELKLNVTGIDKSKSMLKIARSKYKKNKNLVFKKSNILKMNLKKKYDVVSALFHILSYQTTDKKINKFFKNSEKHLNTNGILIFDFWYEDGVFNLQQPLRFREVENKYFKVRRITNSKWFKKKDLIEDIHNLTVFNKKNKSTKSFQEIHPMRYFNLETVKKFLKKNKLKFIKSLDLNTNKHVSNKSWGALVIAKKI